MFWTSSQHVATVLRAMAEARQAEAARIGELVAQLRVRKGWSQEDLAHEIGVSAATVSRWERGLNRGSSPNVRRLAGALGVDPAVFRPAEPDLETQLDRIEAELSRQGEILNALLEAETVRQDEKTARSARRAKQQARSTPRAAGRLGGV